MANDPVIYEVNLAIARSRADEFDRWLSDHVREMLALPGFTDAQTLAVEPDGNAPDHAPLQRTVQYHLTDRAALQLYFQQHAERMRAEGKTRFGDDLNATRRILAAPRTEDTDQTQVRCANCDDLLDGQYCSACGQRHRTRMISVWELLRAAFDDILSWDSRVWRSLRPLLFSPGVLTAEYLAGRRVHYTPPVRMYLVLSISFFLLSSLPALNDFQAANMLGINENEASINLTLSEENREANEAARDRMQGVPILDIANDKPTVVFVSPDDVAAAAAPSDDPEAEAPADTDEEDSDPCDIDDAEINIPGVDPEAANARIRRICRNMTSDDGRVRFAENFGDLAPNLLIVLLPFIALVGKIIYPLSRRYYVEHLLFFTHLHSFLFLLLMLLMFLSAFATYFPGQPINIAYAWIAAGIYVLYYLYRSLRRVFGQGRIATLFKMFLFWIAYVFLTSILLAIGAMLAALTL